MYTCKECGREINPGSKRCSYCHSKIISITAQKVISKSKDLAQQSAEKTAEFSSDLYKKTNHKIEDIKHINLEEKTIKSFNNLTKIKNKIKSAPKKAKKWQLPKGKK